MASPKPPASSIKLFYSYSHKDEALRKKLETHLSLLQSEGVISGWHDRRILAGTEWDRAISENLDRAGIILLLVSAEFLASRYCRDVEIARAMERHESGTARVIPVILRPVDWHTAPFGKLQALPQDGKAVTEWTNRDKAFTDIARGIREAVITLSGAASSTNGVHLESAPSNKAVPLRLEVDTGDELVVSQEELCVLVSEVLLEVDQSGVEVATCVELQQRTGLEEELKQLVDKKGASLEERTRVVELRKQLREIQDKERRLARGTAILLNHGRMGGHTTHPMSLL